MVNKITVCSSLKTSLLNFTKFVFMNNCLLYVSTCLFQGLRDSYRELELAGMRQDLVFTFIETQTLMLAPICPHICEHIWNLLGKKTSIMSAAWPVAGPVDEKLIQLSQYLVSAAHDFRIRLIQLMTPGKGKKVVPPRPTHATIYVAKTYPPWQNTVLTTMKTLFEVSKTMYLCNYVRLFLHLNS